MPTLLHFKAHLEKYGQSHAFLYSFLPIIFFWAVFDTFVSFIVPNALVSAGFSLLAVGLIIGSSSVWGAGFDVLFSKILKNAGYKLLFGYLLGLSFAVLGLLWLGGSSLLTFLAIMLLWGVYYDFFGFGTFDLVGKHIEKAASVSSFGMIGSTKALATLIAPLIIGLVMVDALNTQTLVLMLVFLVLASSAYLFHLGYYRGSPHTHPTTALTPTTASRRHSLSLLGELKLWLKIERKIYPVLILVLFLNIIDAFFWTLGPIIAEHIMGASRLGGLFISAYVLPPLLAGMHSGYFTKKFGKKRTAFTATLISCLGLTSLFYFQQPAILIGSIFVSSLFNAIAWPAIRGAIADYIFESPKLDTELEGIQDFSANSGYVIGPILAGGLAMATSHLTAFAVLGVLGVVLCAVLLVITPKHITVRV